MPCLIVLSIILMFLLFFFNDTATTEIYTLSLHDALPIFHHAQGVAQRGQRDDRRPVLVVVEDRDVELLAQPGLDLEARSEEHTSELQSRQYLVCRLLLEKKQTTTRKKTRQTNIANPH